jgi:tetratricopeptide (TPR) repeat protein
LGQQEEAIACSEQAVSLDPNNARAWEQLGVSAYNLGNYERALEAFRTTAKVGQPTAALWTYQGFALRALGRQEEALACYEQAVSLDPNDARVWQVLGLSAFILGNYERALEAFCTAAKVGQRTADLWTYQASALRVLGRHEEALACSEHAVALDPNNATAWEELGFTACTLGNYERGLETFRIATKVGQQTTDLLRYQAIAHRALGRQEEALACSEQAVSLDPNDALAWEQLGRSASALGSHERALEAFRTSAKVGKASGRILQLQANALRRLGRTKEGLDVVEEALSLETTNADLWYFKAWTLSELDRIEDALQCMDRARHCGAAPQTYHHGRGGILLLAGRYQQALVELEAGLKVAPDDRDLQVDRLIALGCLRQLGPSMEALPSALGKVNMPQTGVTSVCDFLHDMALHGLRRGETQIGRGLFAATLEMKDWAASEWFGKQVGRFLRQVLDVQPQMFSAFVTIVHERVEDENVLKLLDPFLQANDLLRTKNVAILERLFVEVRELVLDIVRRVDPELYQQVERLT